jgi:hypothetical protein
MELMYLGWWEWSGTHDHGVDMVDFTLTEFMSHQSQETSSKQHHVIVDIRIRTNLSSIYLLYI